MAKQIICIGRQYGSGGHNIGQMMAEKLQIPYYDQNLISLAVQKSGLRSEMLEQVDEKPINPWMYTVLHDTDQPFLHTDSLPNDALFHLQSEIILQAASEGSCVIVGRCADFILRDAGFHPLSLFFCAPMEDRVKRTMEHENLEEKAATQRVRRMDKQRSSYYNFYTGSNWGNPENYDFCINTSYLGIEKTAEGLCALVQSITAE